MYASLTIWTSLSLHTFLSFFIIESSAPCSVSILISIDNFHPGLLLVLTPPRSKIAPTSQHINVTQASIVLQDSLFHLQERSRLHWSMTQPLSFP